MRSVYNADESAGWMEGELWVRNVDDKTGTHARLQAVNLDGNVEGLLVGRSGSPKGGLLANFSATFDASSTGGFSNGKLGTGASGNEALLFGRGCVSDTSKGGDKPADPQKTKDPNQTAPTDGTK